MGKKVLSLVLAFALVVTACVGLGAAKKEAFADDSVKVVPYRVYYITYIDPGISRSGSTFTCRGSADYSGADHMTLTIELQRSTDDVNFSTYKTWTVTNAVSGTNYYKSSTAPSGYYYRTKVTARVYSAANVLWESDNASSSSIHY